MYFQENAVSTRVKGFTVVELLVVIVVIGILAVLTIVSYAGIAERAAVASMTSDLDNISKLLKLDYVENEKFPTSLADINSGQGNLASSGTTLHYAIDSMENPQDFCVTATNGGVSYRMTNNGSLEPGACLGTWLVMHLDAADSVSYSGSGATWHDTSGNDNDATIYNGAAYEIANGGVLSFDGINDYAVTPTLTNIRSVNMFVYKNSTDASWHYLLDGRPGIGLGWFANIEIGSAWSNFYVNGVSVASDWSSLPSDTWFNLYIELDSDYDSTINFMSRFSLNECLAGKISDIKVYSRVLTEAEIQQNFESLRDRFGI